MNSGLYDAPGCSATCSAAARASWLAFPATKPSKLNSGMRLERSACGERGVTARAARTAGADVLTSSGVSAGSRLSDTRIGEGKNSPPMRQARGGEEFRPHRVDARHEPLLHPLQHKAVGSEQAQLSGGRRRGVQFERPD